MIFLICSPSKLVVLIGSIEASVSEFSQKLHRQTGSPTAPPQWNNFMSAGIASNHIRPEHLLCFLPIHLRITVCRIIFACNQRFWNKLNNVIITIISILKIITTSTDLIFIISWSPSRITQHSSLHAKKGYPPNLPECPLIFPPTSSATAFTCLWKLLYLAGTTQGDVHQR